MIEQEKATPTKQETSFYSNRRSNSLATLFNLFGLASLSKNRPEASSANQNEYSGVIAKPLLSLLLAALKSHDEPTFAHSQRVGILATRIASHLGWNESQVRILEVAALLHDFGKISVPGHLLHKPAALSSAEKAVLIQYMNSGMYLLQASQICPEVVEIISHSVRDYAIRNQIDNVSQDATHLGSRILAVADAYDSLRSDQVYRSGKSHEDVMLILSEQSSSRFDPTVIAAFKRWIDEKGGPLLMYEKSAQRVPQKMGENGLDNILSELNIQQIMQYLFALEEHYTGFYLVDADRKVMLWSLGMEEITGNESSDVLQTPWSAKHVHYLNEKRRPLDQHDQPLLHAHSAKKTIVSEAYLLSQHEQLEEYEIQSIPIMDELNQVQGVLEILFNKTACVGQAGGEMQELKLAASRDALTKLPNRGELEHQLQEMWQRYVDKKTEETFSVIFLDVDFFKSINDSHGHAVGDRVLINLSRLMEEETYSGEIVGRYGGEEFVILCPDTDLKMGIHKANRLRNAIEKASIGGLPTGAVTSSFGVAQAEEGDVVHDIISRSDKALYVAKETGRNRVCSLTKEGASKPNGAAQNNIDTDDEFKFIHEFNACVSSDMLIYKLKAFVVENNAKIDEVSQTEVIMTVGKAGLFSSWGKDSSKQPVILHLDIERHDRQQGGQSEAKMTATVTPKEYSPTPEQFRSRATNVLKTLREFLAST